MLFDDDFEVFLANTEESKELHYALRYQVYCQETQFEDSDEFHDQQEVDDLDEFSVHFIARSKKTKEWVGAIRLIVGGLKALPTFNLLASGSFHQQRMIDGVRCSNPKVALEISRLCILGAYRKTGASLSQTADRRRQPEILLGLMRVAYTYCLNKQIDVCLFTVTKPLARIMRNLKLNFVQAGEETEYHGIRVPYYTHIPSYLGNIHLKSPATFDMFSRQALAYQLYDSAFPETVLPAFAKKPACFSVLEDLKEQVWVGANNMAYNGREPVASN